MPERDLPPRLASPGLRRGLDGVCLLGLLIFALTLSAPILAGGVPIALDVLYSWGRDSPGGPGPMHNPVLADSALLYFPWQVFIRRSLAGGEWPLWYPDIGGGYPFQGNPQTQLYYPVMWLLWLLPLPTAWQVSAVFSLWLAGAGMYVLARTLGASRAGSLLAGLAFAGSSQLFMALEITGVASIYGWLPWVLAATERAWRQRSWPWTALAGVGFGILALSGHLQWFLYSALFLAAWLGGRLLQLGWRCWRQPGSGAWAGWRGQFLRAAAILAWGPALSAVQLLPFLELVSHASRVGGEIPRTVADRFDDHMLRLLGRQLTVFVPQIFGTSAGNIGRVLWYNECAYIGLVPLALAIVALVLRREPRVYFLGLLGASALAVAAGMPGFNGFHRLPILASLLPTRISYLYIVCAALLSAFGFDAWLALARRRRGAAAGLGLGLLGGALPIVYLLAEQHRLAAAQSQLYDLQTSALAQALLIAGAAGIWVGALVILGGDHTARRRALLTGLVLGIVVVDLLTYAPDYNTYSPATALTPQTKGAAALRARPERARILTPDPGPIYQPDTVTLFGLQGVQSYDSLQIARYEAFWAAVDPVIRTSGVFNYMMRPTVYTSTQAALLNVRYIVLPPTAAALPPPLERVYADADEVIYRNPTALPRVFIAGGAAVLSPAAILDRLAAPDFDPRRTVLLEDAPPPGFPLGPAPATGQATITAYHTLSVDVTARLDQPGWLVLGDNNYPGWEVTVDDRPAPLYTAYGLIRAVPLPTGTHQVRFAFRPRSVLIGGVISGLALLLVGLILIGSRARRNAAPEPTTLS